MKKLLVLSVSALTLLIGSVSTTLPKAEAVAVDNAKATVSTVSVFKDIKGHWAESSINQAYKLDLVKGYADGTYHPKSNVTRAEFAAMLYRATSQNKDVQQNYQFPDMTTNWANNEVNTPPCVTIVVVPLKRM